MCTWLDSHPTKRTPNACRNKNADKTTQVLAEASPLDPVWGIGLRADSPAAKTPASWRGQNLLGQALQQVRARMIADAVEGVAAASASSP